MPKQRLDILLIERGLCETRSKAQALIAAGKVYSDEVRLDKPGHAVSQDAPLAIREPEHPWVSRGGMKLAHALEHFAIDPKDAICIDVGASTGGFTDVLLNKGAQKVYAVDVGHGQLDWKLRQDSRVVVLEKVNARYLSVQHVPEQVGIIVCDASFISLKTVLPATLALAGEQAKLVALIKPQFEVGRDRIGDGVVRDEALHKEVCDEIVAWLNGREDWHVIGVTQSPITGPKGNREFLVAAMRTQKKI